jgi:hypothetical protein
MSLATEENTGGVIDGIAARFAEADARRRQELDEAIGAGGRFEVDRKLCPCGCLAPLGECETKRPRIAPPVPPLKTFTPEPQTRSENAQPPPAPIATPVNPEPPARPAQEEPMPCGTCGKTGHNSRSCAEKKEAAPAKTKTIPPPPPKTAAGPRKPAVRVVARVASVEDLLARREALTVELASVEEQLRARLADEEARLEKLREAVGAAAARAKLEAA